MKGFILFSDPIGRESGDGSLSTVHRTVRAAVDHACRQGGAVFRPPSEPDYYLAKVRRAIERDALDPSDSWWGPRLEFLVTRDGRTDVVALKECEVML